MQPWWQRDQIISAFIVGTFSMTATFISVVLNSRKQAANASRRRRSWRLPVLKRGLITVAVVLVGAAGYQMAEPALGTLGIALPGAFGASSAPSSAPASSAPARGHAPSSAAEGSERSVAGPAATEFAAEPTATGLATETIEAADRDAAGAPRDQAAAVADTAMPDAEIAPSAGAATAASSWLLADGLQIRYRHATFLPGACSATTLARGNWTGGWSRSIPVACADEEWLVFDVAPLVAAGRITRNLTYCVNFQTADGKWGDHDRLDAPGLDAVAFEAGPPIGPGRFAIGFRVVSARGRDRVVFATEQPRVYC